MQSPDDSAVEIEVLKVETSKLVAVARQAKGHKQLQKLAVQMLACVEDEEHAKQTAEKHATLIQLLSNELREMKVKRNQCASLGQLLTLDLEAKKTAADVAVTKTSPRRRSRRGRRRSSSAKRASRLSTR